MKVWHCYYYRLWPLCCACLLVGHCSLERQSFRVLSASEQHYCSALVTLFLAFRFHSLLWCWGLHPGPHAVIGAFLPLSCTTAYLLITVFLRVLAPLPLLAPLHAPLRVLFFSMATALGSSSSLHVLLCTIPGNWDSGSPTFPFAQFSHDSHTRISATRRLCLFTK